MVGFGVRAKPTESKTYIIQYRNAAAGTSRRKSIGAVGPKLSFADAKTKAQKLLASVVLGEDPVEQGQAKRKAPTVTELADQYLAKHARPKKRPKSVKEDEAMLTRFILPAMGSKKVAEVTLRQIQALHNRLSDTPYQANRVLSLTSKMFNLSVRWGMRADNPARGIDKFTEEKRVRWLSVEELERLLVAMADHPNQKAAEAIRFQILTGARIGEVLNATWGEIDFKSRRWSKPSHHTKQKRTEHLPLSELAVALLAKRFSGQTPDKLIFPGRSAKQPQVNLKRFWVAVTETAGLENYRIHDNRHTYASQLVSAGVSLAIVGRLLGHSNLSTTQRYAHLADDPLREAADSFMALRK